MMNTVLSDESLPVEERLEMAIYLLKIKDQQIARLTKAAQRSSWDGAVDRQGGSFTAEELDPNRGWK